jgi:hypothetical protein
MRTVLLALALLPYASLALFDGWLHERSRRVPRVEQWLHAGAALSLIVFLVAAFRSHGALAIGALAVFAPIAAADEVGFHGHLAARERRLHFASYAALGVFVAVWIWSGGIL